jgi:type I restriction enzyme S subunit
MIAPLAEQHRIVSAIEQQFTRLDAGVAALKRVQAKLKRYRAAVLKAAVEGKLTEAWRAEHPATEPASILLERILKERRARWEADLRAKGKDPAKVKYVEPAKPDLENLPELPEGWCWATLEQLSDENRAITYGVVKLGEPVVGALGATKLKVESRTEKRKERVWDEDCVGHSERAARGP